jgi:hypothetical protein
VNQIASDMTNKPERKKNDDYSPEHSINLLQKRCSCSEQIYLFTAAAILPIGIKLKPDLLS